MLFRVLVRNVSSAPKKLHQECLNQRRRKEEVMYMETVHLDQGRREVLNALMNVIHFQHTKEVVTVNSVIITNLLDFRQLKRKKNVTDL